MNQLITLQVTNRGQNLDPIKGGPLAYGFDVEDIVSPIRYNSNLNKCYFTARTIKDGANNNLNGAKIDYMATDSLTTIQAQSVFLLLLNVTIRRGVNMGAEAHIFVASKISENIIPAANGGSKFFYIEDGDVLPVEYTVSQSVATIMAQTVPASSITIQDNGTDMPSEPNLNFVGFTVEDNSGSSTDIINVKEHTYAEMDTMRLANAFPVGAKYLITDRADAGIEVTAIGNNILSLKADGLFLNPDFQDVGDYSGSGLLVPKGSNLGVWTVGSEATSSNGDIVFWNGLMYQILDVSAFDGTAPDVNNVAYNSLSKNITNGYILEVDPITYDFTNDSILAREDKRSNFVQNISALSEFQWGNNSVSQNKIITGVYTCINNKGSIINNTVIRGVVVSDNTNVGTVSESTFECYNGSLTANFNAGKDMRACSMMIYAAVTMDPTVATTTGDINRKFSTFESTLNMADPAVFSAGVLTIPASKNYIGVFTLTGNTGQTITKIINIPAPKRFAFKCANGITQNFSHSAVATATADILVSDAAASNAIVGRTNGADQIEYEKSGNKNVRTNIVKLV